MLYPYNFWYVSNVGLSLMHFRWIMLSLSLVFSSSLMLVMLCLQVLFLWYMYWLFLEDENQMKLSQQEDTRHDENRWSWVELSSRFLWLLFMHLWFLFLFFLFSSDYVLSSEQGEMPELPRLFLLSPLFVPQVHLLLVLPFLETTGKRKKNSSLMRRRPEAKEIHLLLCHVLWSGGFLWFSFRR